MSKKIKYTKLQIQDDAYFTVKSQKLSVSNNDLVLYMEHKTTLEYNNVDVNTE